MQELPDWTSIRRKRSRKLPQKTLLTIHTEWTKSLRILSPEPALHPTLPIHVLIPIPLPTPAGATSDHRIRDPNLETPNTNQNRTPCMPPCTGAPVSVSRGDVRNEGHHHFAMRCELGSATYASELGPHGDCKGRQDRSCRLVQVHSRGEEMEASPVQLYGMRRRRPIRQRDSGVTNCSVSPFFHRHNFILCQLDIEPILSQFSFFDSPTPRKV